MCIGSNSDKLLLLQAFKFKKIKQKYRHIDRQLRFFQYLESTGQFKGAKKKLNQIEMVKNLNEKKDFTNIQNDNSGRKIITEVSQFQQRNNITLMEFNIDKFKRNKERYPANLTELKAAFGAMPVPYEKNSKSNRLNLIYDKRGGWFFNGQSGKVIPNN